MPVVKCPNKSLPAWKELVKAVGENTASSLFHRNEGEIPSVEEASFMLKASKVGQMKSAVKYITTTASNSATDLVNNLSRIVQKIGNDLYLVKGVNIDKKPTDGLEQLVHQPNKRFLESVNKNLGINLFNLEQVSAGAEADALGKEIINDIKAGTFPSLYGMTYKAQAENAAEHADMIKELVGQATDDYSRTELENTLGKSIVDKAVKYGELTNIKPKQELFSNIIPGTSELADVYKKENNINTPKGETFYELDKERAKRIADAFENLKHTPNDPLAKKAYTEFVSQNNSQAEAILKSGLKIELSNFGDVLKDYKDANDMINDIKNNNHLYVTNSREAFGNGPVTKELLKEHPLLQESKFKDINGKTLLNNDVFRFVHDYFGHTERGNDFSDIGEENAWDIHARMYTDLARRAMTTETRGQNSWVNFGLHMRNEDGTFKTIDNSNIKFPEQKVGLIPEEFSKLREPEKIVEPVQEGVGSGKPAPGTYKVSINQEALDKIVANNIIAKEKTDQNDQTGALDINNKILDDAAPRYSKAYGEAQTKSVNHTVLKYLGKKFNLPFEVVNDPTSEWRGKFENGKVFINEAKVNEYTALHEYLHPFTMAMQKDNPELYNNLIADLQSTKEGKAVLEEVQKRYPELGAKDQIDEALVTHLSELVNQDKFKEKPWYQKVIDWFKEMFGKNGISISGLDMNMSLGDIADKIVDPAYSADLKKYYDFNDAATKYQKIPGQSEKFDQILEKVKTKLTLDINIKPKNKDEETRKFHSGQQLANLQQNKDVFHALNDYVTSAIINAKKINEKFDQFKEFYDSRDGKLNKDEILQGMNVLSDMEQHIALYNESRFVVDAVREENADEYEDNFKILANRLTGDTKIISDYHQYGLKLMSDWLYPHTKKAVDAAVKSGNKAKMPGYDDYVQIKNDNPKIPDSEAMERGTKKWIQGQMEHATSDIGFFNSYMSGVLNSKDPISQLVALSLKDEFAKNNNKLLKVKDGIQNVITKAVGTKVFTTNKDHKEFYAKYVREVENYEKTGVDENGNPTFGYVKRTAFHQPYKYDEFYKAKREMFKQLGIRPNKNDEIAYANWNARKEAWFDKHTVRQTNDKGEVVSTTPTDIYRNADHAKIANDPVYKEIYKHYQDGNDKLGNYQLKYGIVPQQSLGGGLFSDLKLSKGLKGNAEQLKKNLKEEVGARINEYYAQDIDGKEFKNIPVRYTRLVDPEDLSHNLGKSVADFWESSSKYKTSKTVEPMVLTLRSFIEGNSFMKVDERTAPEIDAKGVKKMGNFVKGLSKTKDQANINRQMVDFLNDTIYGESEKKANIKSPFLNLKYMVYKKGDTSANGKPHREYVYSLEDLKKKTGSETIEHDHFTKGDEKDVNGYGVTLVRNDKILSVNKLSRGLNSLSATVNLGGNVIAGASHLLRGIASNVIEGTGGKYFSKVELGSAYKEYFKNLTDFSFLEDTRGGKGSKVSQLLTHYGTMQGEFLNEYGKHIGQGVVNKLFRRSALFFSIHGAEHLVQSTQMIAAMKHIKVLDTATGKNISLFDAHEKGADGYVKVKDGVKWDKTQDDNFRDLIQSINKDRGNYSEFDKAGISRLWWGKMLIMFRRHIFNGIKSRWGSEYVDYERGGATQGYYRSFMTTLASEYNEMRLNGKFRKMTDDEAYHFKKTLADVGMFAMLATVLVPAFKDENDHKTGASDYLALFSRRLQQDVSFFLNPLEWKKVIQSPIVTGSTVDKFYEFFGQMATSPSEEYEKDGAGYQAGDNKAMAKLKKLIPVYRVITNLQDPQDMLKFYDLKRPLKVK